MTNIDESRDAAIKQISNALGLLNSMILSGESHSPSSKQMFREATDALNGIAQRDKEQWELVEAAKVILEAAESYHNSTGHAVEGSSMQGSCDAICYSMVPLRVALSKFEKGE